MSRYSPVLLRDRPRHVQVISAVVAPAALGAGAGILVGVSAAGYWAIAVIAAGGDYSDTVTINAGSADGITANETVINGDGLVGTVVAADQTTATVQLATDAAATVGIRMSNDGQIGALSGTANDFSGTAPLKLTLFNANAALKPGQELVTFGSVGGRPYVPGIPIGRITKVTTQPGSLTPTALVTPFADFTGLGVLGVVTSK